jgi:hypothetical protein
MWEGIQQIHQTQVIPSYNKDNQIFSGIQTVNLANDVRRGITGTSQVLEVLHIGQESVHED